VRLPRAVWWTAAAWIAVVLTVVLSFGPVVRSRAAREGAKRGLEVRVDGVSPGFFSVRLEGVTARLEGVPAVSFQAPEVRIDFDAFLRPREVTIGGGRVQADGSLDDIVDAVAQWRQRRPARTGGGAARRSVGLRGEGLAVGWTGPDAEAMQATGVAFSRGSDGATVAVEHIEVRRKSLSLDVSVASADFGADGVLHGAHATSADVVWRPDDAAASEAPPAPATTADPAPPPLPLAVAPSPAGKRGRPARSTGATKSVSPASLSSPAEASPPLLPVPDIHRLRARAALLTKVAAPRIAPDAAARIDGLSLRYESGNAPLTVGPGPASVTHEPDQLAIEFSTTKVRESPPLAIRASLPLERGDVRITLSGGPIALASLGVREGAGGFADVDRALLSGKGSVVLADSGEALTFDVDLGVRGLGIRQPRISLDTVHGLDVGVSARGVIDDTGLLRLDDAEASLGSLRVRARGTLEQAPDHTAGSFAFDVPTAACQSLLESIPTALLPELQGTEVRGTFGGKGIVTFDSRHLDDLVLEYDIDDICKMTAVPAALAKEQFSGTFVHRVYTPDGTIAEEETGPGTPSWTPLDAISPYMQVAVLTTEDGAFFHHHGFNHAAIRGSLIANLKARRFVRGASTITMQTAKNLFLTRDKTLARKLEEVILTDYLERSFEKTEIMELYLNVIEFGPNIYGITTAADHYFGRRPDELNLAECLFLSSLLPHPLASHKLYEKGQIPESWMKNIHSLMEIAEKNGKISPAELREGLTEPIVFFHPDTPRPVRRPPITGSFFTGESDQSGWRAIE